MPDRSIRFQDYQNRAMESSRLQNEEGSPEIIALLGLGGESGSVQTLYKKRRRDGDQFSGFKQKLKEELGDVLWYVTAIATLEGIALDEIAIENLEKTHSRWLPTGEDDLFSFDEHFPESERLPRKFVAQFISVADNEIGERVQVLVNGIQCGNTLKDNAYVSDGYRFHDVFHMTCAALLGWSPVFRALMKRKRKSDPEVDEVEDGGRAIVTDEALAAVIFSYAVQHRYLNEIKVLDWHLLDTCHGLTLNFEVGKRSHYEWEQVILKTFEVWRAIQSNAGNGWVRFDADARTVEFSTEELV